MRQRNDDHFICGRNPLGLRAKTALICVAAIAALLGTTLQPASAATEVQGQLDEMRVRADNASIREVLDALSKKFNLKYGLPPTINRVVSGLYSGTLHQVLARILDGNSYIIKVSDNGTELVVLGKSRATTIVPANQAIAAQETPVAPSVSASQPPPPLDSFLSVK